MKSRQHRFIQFAFGVFVAAAVLAGCSAGSQSTSPLGPSIVKHADPSCPASGIMLTSGNNGTYIVAVNHSCVLIAPYATGCTPDEESGYTFSFAIVSGGSHGTLTGFGSPATFKRTSAGDVGIDLYRTYHDAAQNCKGSAPLEYGSVTLD